MPTESVAAGPGLRRARERFLTGEPPGRLVRPEIAISWRRSALWGARPEAPALPYSGGLDQRGALYRAAHPVLDRLADRLDYTRAAMLLADRDARVVARWVGDSGLRAMMDRTDSAPGFSLREEFCGTNGLGSVVEEGRGFFVVGHEHYAERFIDYACYGAPIKHPMTGRLQGVLTFMCRAEHATPLMLPFVEETCEAIRDRLLAQVAQPERQLLDAFAVAGRRTRRAVIALNQQTIISSPSAARLLGDVEHASLWEIAATAIDRRITTEQLLGSERGAELTVRASPVFDGDHVVGAVMELTPPRAPAPPPPSHPQRQLLRWLGGRSRAWLAAMSAAARVAGTGQPVLIVGEPGVGKLELAKALHELSNAAGELHVLHAALAPIDGLAGWLGRARASCGRPGTLVLTHLEALTEFGGQALAALLDERGGDGPRIIGTVAHGAGEDPATGPHLERLAVHRLNLSPLRERSDDVPELVRRLLARHRGDGLRLAPAALHALVRARWPGNVRQLDLLVRGLVAERGAGVVGLADLPPEVVGSSRRAATQLERLEMHAIVGALRKTGGNKQLAAAELGISRATLYRKLRSFHLDLDRTTF
jgi:transcriptional regulator of acetoin/glycerol metabolism